MNSGRVRRNHPGDVGRTRSCGRRQAGWILSLLKHNCRRSSFYFGRLIGRTTRLSLSPTLGMEEEMSLCEHLGDEVRYNRDNENDSCQGIFLKCWKGYRDKLKNFLGRIFIFPFTGVLISLNPPFKSSTSHFLFPLKVSLFPPSSYHNLSCLQFLFLTSPVKKSRRLSHLPPRSTFPPVALPCSCSRSHLMSSLALLCKRTHTEGHQKPHHPKTACTKTLISSLVTQYIRIPELAVQDYPRARQVVTD